MCGRQNRHAIRQTYNASEYVFFLWFFHTFRWEILLKNWQGSSKKSTHKCTFIFFFYQIGQTRMCRAPKANSLKYIFRQCLGKHTGFSSWLVPHGFPVGVAMLDLIGSRGSRGWSLQCAHSWTCVFVAQCVILSLWGRPLPSVHMYFPFVRIPVRFVPFP